MMGRKLVSRSLYRPSEWSETGGYTVFICVCPSMCVSVSTAVFNSVCPTVPPTTHQPSPSPNPSPTPSPSPTIPLTFSLPLPPLSWLPSLNETIPYDLQWTFYAKVRQNSLQSYHVLTLIGIK